MIRVNLFEPWEPNVYGTATASDIFSVTTMAALFCNWVGVGPRQRFDLAIEEPKNSRQNGLRTAFSASKKAF